MQIIKALLYDL